MSNLNAVIARFKSETSDVADESANALRERALSATTLEDFYKRAETYRRRINACYVKTQLTSPDDWSYSRIYQLLDANGMNMQLVIRFCNNAQRTPLSEVNPLGYVLVQQCKIRKIISMDQDARVITYNDGWTTYSEHARVTWFMPAPAAPYIHDSKYILNVIAALLAHDIDPRNFKASVAHLMETVLPKFNVRIYVDYVYAATGERWRKWADVSGGSMRNHCLAQAMFADVGTPNPFDYPSATVRGMGL